MIVNGDGSRLRRDVDDFPAVTGGYRARAPFFKSIGKAR